MAGLTVCSMTAALAVDGDAITLTIGSREALVGGQVQIPVTLVTDAGIGPMSIMLFMEFDGDRLQFVNAELGPEVPESRALSTEAHDDSVGLVVTGVGHDVIGDGLLLTVAFVVAESATLAPIPLVGADFSAARAEDSDPEGGLLDVVSLEVTVVNGVILPVRGSAPIDCFGQAMALGASANKGGPLTGDSVPLLAGAVLLWMTGRIARRRPAANALV